MAPTQNATSFGPRENFNSSRRLVAIGASAGGLNAFGVVLAALPKNFPAPIVIVQHLSADFPSMLAQLLGKKTRLLVKQAEEGDRLRVGHVYIAPPGKHLFVTPNFGLSLSLAPKVRHSRPAADVLFASAAKTCGKEAIGVVLTGGDGDGSEGIQAIKAAGGVTIAQDVPSSQQPSMPRSAAATGSVDFVLPLGEIAATLVALVSAPPAALKSVPALLKSVPASKPPPSTPLLLRPSVPRLAKAFNPDMVAEGTALERVHAAWQSAALFSGKGAGPSEVGKLVTAALKEIDTGMEVLVVAEAALVDQNRALEDFRVLLREERERYQELLNAFPSAALVTDAVGVIRGANLAAAELLGVGLRYIVGRPLVRHVHKGDRLDFPRRMRDAFAAGGWPSALRMRTRGDLTAVTASASAMRNSQGEYISLLWLMRASEAEVSEAEVSEAEVSEAEVSEAEVSEAEVSEAEVSEAEVTPQEDADYTNS